MTARTLARLLAVWAAATAIACVVVRSVFRLRPADRSVDVTSVWRGGQVVARALLGPAEHDAAVDAAAALPGATLVREHIVGDAPVVTWPRPWLALSFVPGRDGLSATYRDRTTYVTPDDLLAMQAYDHGITFPSLQIAVGLDLPVALARASDALGVPVRELLDHGTLRRFRVERVRPSHDVTSDSLTDAAAREAAVAMGRYLARGVDDDGRFRYLVDAPTNRTLPGYDWPRHAGATYFLAQVASLTGDADVGYAALRAAGRLRDRAMIRCGTRRCIGEEGFADVGSSALAVLAFVQVARTKLDESYALLVPDLAAFLRSQQRPDGEFMHLYDRTANRPVDVQVPYFSGEAALALARAHALLGDPRDLDAARRSVEYLVGPAWSFFGSNYYFGEEHWTCQAMDDLWDRAPDSRALDFCLRWQAYDRKLMYGRGDTPFDAEGAYGIGPILTPRLTPVASRAEAGIATLDALLRRVHAVHGAPTDAERRELDRLDLQMRRSLALLLRHELGGARDGPQGGDRSYLLADPAAVKGAMPGSEVDWQLRIDYAQHAGSALLRWLALSERRHTALEAPPSTEARPAAE